MKNEKLHFLLLLIPFFLLPNVSFTQVQEATLLGNWQDNSLPIMAFGRYNDVWGIVVDDVEYAVMGSTMGTHFISLEPENGVLNEVAFVPGKDQGTHIIHRDYHSYQNYMYAVADEGQSSLQIIDFSGLPESVEVVYDSDSYIKRAHNIFIDEANARLYDTNGNFYSLEDPENPIKIGDIPVNSHDVFVRDHYVISNNGNAGMDVYDCFNPSNPILIGELVGYINSGYNHSGWMSEDNSHYFLCDESPGRTVKSVDISDFTDMKVVDSFKSDNENPNHISHNAMVRDNLLYVSYYSDGLQVFDISDPTNVVRKSFYDTFPGTNSQGFQGAWGVYALLPSGRILVSDMASGLYLLEIPSDRTLIIMDDEFVNQELSVCTGDEINFDFLIGNDFESTGVTLSANNLPTDATINFSQNSALPGDVISVTINNLTTPGLFDFELMATDAEASNSVNIPLEVIGAPPILELLEPINESENVGVNPILKWEFNGLDENLLEISSTNDFTDPDILQFWIIGATYVVNDGILEENKTYYWRVSKENTCAESSSEVFSFTTGSTSSNTSIIEEESLIIFPNPTTDAFRIETFNIFQENYSIEQ